MWTSGVKEEVKFDKPGAAALSVAQFASVSAVSLTYLRSCEIKSEEALWEFQETTQMANSKQLFGLILWECHWSALSAVQNIIYYVCIRDTCKLFCTNPCQVEED